MSAIVAIAENGIVTMGGDRASCCEGQVSHRAQPKVFRREGYLIGAAGSVRAAHLAQFGEGLPSLTKVADADLDAHMETVFSRWLLDSHADVGFERREENERRFDGSMLVGARGRLWIVFGDYTTVRVDGYEALGSGGPIALGALYATEGQPPLERIMAALEAAERFNAYVRGPFDVVSSEGE